MNLARVHEEPGKGSHEQPREFNYQLLVETRMTGSKPNKLWVSSTIVGLARFCLLISQGVIQRFIKHNIQT